jgi:hypothetical protein
LDDDTVTGCDTKRYTSRFYWSNNKFSRTIVHPASNLPEISVNEGSVFASWFQSIFSRKVDDSIDHAHYSSQCHAVVSEEDNLTRIPGKVIEFENEIIHPGETLLYSNEGTTSLARIQDVFVDAQGVIRIKLLCTSGKEVVATQQSVRSPDNPDIGYISMLVPDLHNTSCLLSGEELKKTAHPPTLIPSQQIFLSWHHITCPFSLC